MLRFIRSGILNSIFYLYLLLFFLTIVLFGLYLIYTNQIYYVPGDDSLGSYRWIYSNFRSIIYKFFTHVSPFGGFLITKSLYGLLELLGFSYLGFHILDFQTLLNFIFTFASIFFTFRIVSLFADKDVGIFCTLLLFWASPKSLFYYGFSTYKEIGGYLTQVVSLYIFLKTMEKQDLRLKSVLLLSSILLVGSFYRHEILVSAGVFSFFALIEKKDIFKSFLILIVSSAYFIPKLIIQKIIGKESYLEHFSVSNSVSKIILFFHENLFFSFYYFSFLLLFLIFLAVREKNKNAKYFSFFLFSNVGFFFILSCLNKIRLSERYLFSINNFLVIGFSFSLFYIFKKLRFSKVLIRGLIFIFSIASIFPLMATLEQKTFYLKGKFYEKQIMMEEVAEHFYKKENKNAIILLENAFHSDTLLTKALYRADIKAKIVQINKNVHLLEKEHDYLIATGTSYNNSYHRLKKRNSGWGQVRKLLYKCKEKTISRICLMRDTNKKEDLSLYSLVYENSDWILLKKIKKFSYNDISIENVLFEMKLELL